MAPAPANCSNRRAGSTKSPSHRSRDTTTAPVRQTNMLGIGEKHELPTILLIDDDLVSREVIATVLTLHGHMVHSAEDGNQALEILEAGDVKPGVVLLDTQLPGLSGSELIAKLRQLSQDEIILISGTTPSDDLIAAADGFLL